MCLFVKKEKIWHMSCINLFPTNRQLVFSSFFPFLKKAASQGQPFLVLANAAGIDPGFDLIIIRA